VSTNFQELIRQANELFAEAEKLRKTERAAAIADIRETCRQHGITLQDLGGVKGPKGPKPAAKPAGAPRFRGPQGETWSGRGPRPGWLRALLAAGESAETYRVG